MQKDKGLLSSTIKIAREAIKAERAKSELIANLSYELRTALTSIMGTAQLLTMDCLLPTQQQYVTDILNVSDAILPLVNRLLNLSEQETQQMRQSVRPFNLKTLLEKVIKQLLFEAKSKGLQVLLDYPSHVPVNVIGAPDLIYQMVIHLSHYLMKNMEHGSIVIQVNCEQGQDEQEPDQFKLSIKDGGQGIQKQDLIRLKACLDQFEPSYIRDYRGIDLGMSITLTYIKLLNVTLEIASETEKGGLFVCNIPLRQMINSLDEKIEVQRKSLSLGASELRILLIEDNGLIQRVYRAVLESIEGCSVDSAMNAQMALEYYMQYSYDLIFMDICLPDSSGIELTQIIRQQEAKGERIPIIAITAHGDAKDKERFLAAGMDEVVIKPISLEAIMSILERWTPATNLSLA